MSDKIKHVFISHINEDDDVLQDLKELLKRNGYEICDGSIDSSKPNDAKDPAYVKSQILAPRIQWAGEMVVLISRDTWTSTFVDWEIEYAQKQGKRIVGVWAHGDLGCTAPANLEKYADAVVGWQADRVMDAIEGKINNWFTCADEERAERVIARFNC
jgi:hypothetical protein